MTMTTETLKINTGKSDVFKINANTVDNDTTINGRAFEHNDGSIAELAASILEHGQLQPCLATKKDGKVTLVFGFRRYLAVKLLNEQGESVPLLVKYTRANAEKQFLLNITENNERAETTCIDDAYNITRLLDVYNWDRKQVAGFYKRSVAWVGQRLKLLALPSDMQKKVHEGSIKGDAAYRLAQVAEKDEDKAREMLAEHGTDGAITAAKVNKAVEEDDELDLVVRRNAKAIRAFFEEFEDADGDDQALRQASFARSFLKWIDGETADRALAAAWSKLTKDG